MMEMRSDELGIDSLIAVEVRSWFLKNFRANIAVLTILSGVTISRLVDSALQDIPAELIPHVQASDEIVVQQKEVHKPPPCDEIPSSTELVDSRRDSSDGPSTLVSRSETPRDTPSETDYESESGIPPEPKQARTACMSFSQSMFWIVHSIIKDKTTLNHSGIFRITGSLRLDDLDRAVQQVGQHHEALRTRFFMDSEQQVRQGILESTMLKLEKANVQSESEAEDVYQRFRHRPFDLSSGELMRVRLLSVSPTVSYLLFACHHIIFDGISQLVVIKDFETAYKRLPLSPNVLQYADYAEKQRSDVDSGSFNDDIKYWKNEFTNFPEPLPLSRSRISIRQPVDDYNINTVSLRVNAALAQKIRDVSTRHRATSFHFYLACFRILLQRFTGAVDFSIGIADGNRKEEAALSSVGPYVNLLPLYFRSDDQTFAESLEQVRRKVLGALAHSQVPFEVLLKELRVTRSPSQSPIFQAFVDYRQGTTETLMFAANKLEMIKFEPGKTAYDVSLDIIDNPGGDVHISVMTQDRLYSSTAARHITDLYEDILREFAEAPLKKVDDDWTFRSSAVRDAVHLGKGTLSSRPLTTNTVF
jgi:hybrid polyketide synthase/nonribosomal peptide synthetase ACE1